MRASAEPTLRDAEGCQHIVQCYGAFDHCEPADGKHYLWIAMQYVEGATFWDVCQELMDMRADPHFADKWYTAGRTLLEHVLKVCQPLQELLKHWSGYMSKGKLIVT